MPLGSVHEKVWAYLEANGTSVVFGNPGSTELPFFADWPERVRWAMALQEASVVGMADGYAQATGRPAFVTLHSAAGLGNGMNGLFTALQLQPAGGHGWAPGTFNAPDGPLLVRGAVHPLPAP